MNYLTTDQAAALAKQALSGERYYHTLCVEKAAVDIAGLYSEDVETARTAAFLHDICKELPKDTLLQMLRGSDIIDPVQSEDFGPVLHAFAGGEYVEKELGLSEDIANAVRYHTTGRAGMSALEKTVFLADCISGDRDFRNLDELREIAKRDPDEACLLALRNSIIHVTKQLKPLNQLSCSAFNWFVAQRGKQNG